jgi:hypothetical protein
MQMALLKGKKAMWSKLGTPEKKYGTDETQWAIDLILSDDESRKWVRSGLAMKERFMDVDGVEVPVIKLKKDTHWKKSGEAKTPVKVVDAYGQDVDPRLIGNGSIVNAQYNVRDWEFQGRSGKTAELVAVQVIELVQFSGKASAGDEFEFLAREEVSLESAPKGDLDLSDDDVFE